MKCPKLKRRVDIGKLGIIEVALDCLKEDCAWWQVGDEQCSILNLTEGVADIAHYLSEIAKKRPTKDSFAR